MTTDKHKELYETVGLDLEKLKEAQPIMHSRIIALMELAFGEGMQHAINIIEPNKQKSDG